MIVWTPATQTDTSDVHHKDHTAVIYIFFFSAFVLLPIFCAVSEEAQNTIDIQGSVYFPCVEKD